MIVGTEGAAARTNRILSDTIISMSLSHGVPAELLLHATMLQLASLCFISFLTETKDCTCDETSLHNIIDMHCVVAGI